MRAKNDFYICIYIHLEQIVNSLFKGSRQVVPKTTPRMNTGML